MAELVIRREIEIFIPSPDLSGLIISHSDTNRLSEGEGQLSGLLGKASSGISPINRDTI